MDYLCIKIMDLIILDKFGEIQVLVCVLRLAVHVAFRFGGLFHI